MSKVHTHPCPKCGRLLRANGTITVDSQALPLDVYQCDECIYLVDFCGQPFESALTFVVDDRGRALDGETLEPIDQAKIKSRSPQPD